ncbi:hypothetical protein QM012_002953 [Aureobasidium pullulans]|uniref:Glycosyltransferase family 17 protein n=1 Tax=Aureobasidium pullulans TaxID=5580 RepID=A0ABR0TB06_AURPU
MLLLGFGRRRLYRRSSLRYLFIALILFIIIALAEALNIHSTLQQASLEQPGNFKQEKIFIVGIHWNNENILRDHWIPALVALAKTIGPQNVFVSIYESGSYDDTKGVLRVLDQMLEENGIPRKVILDNTTHLDDISKPPSDNGWVEIPNGTTQLRRIPYLANLRNVAMQPLYELQDTFNVVFDKILFLNDVVFTTPDIKRLLSTRDGNYAAACALDFSKPPAFYDTFALRDLEGHEAATTRWPYFRSRTSREALKSGQPTPVTSCWNGIVAMNAKPFYQTPRLTFRGVADSLARLHVEGLWFKVDHELSRNHYLSPDLVDLRSASGSNGKFLLTPNEVAPTCHANGFAPARPQDSKKERKIYDLVLMSTELNWLEIRLHTLSDYVDYFVIVELPTTFTGKPKPLYLRDNWDLFKDYHHKIIYRVVEDPVQSTRIWDHEDYFRNALFTAVFPGLEGTTQEAYPKDVLIVSDMDEIIRPGVMLLLRYCDVPARLTLRTQFYYYSFQWRHRGPQWAHPDVTVYRGPDTLMPNDLRQGLLENGWSIITAVRRWRDRGTLWNAGWHCSSCFATVAEMHTKMHSFSHQGWNTAENRDSRTLIDRVRQGLDLFGRADELYDRIEDNPDVPSFITAQFEQKGRFRYLLNRDGEDAGFDDVSTAA